MWFYTYYVETTCFMQGPCLIRKTHALLNLVYSSTHTSFSLDDRMTIIPEKYSLANYRNFQSGTRWSFFKIESYRRLKKSKKSTIKSMSLLVTFLATLKISICRILLIFSQFLLNEMRQSRPLLISRKPLI